MAGDSGKTRSGTGPFENDLPATEQGAPRHNPRPGLARSALSALLGAAVLAGPGANTAWAVCTSGSPFSQELTLNWASISPALTAGSNYTGSATIPTANGNVTVAITLTNTGVWNGSGGGAGGGRPSVTGGNLALGGTFNPATETIVMALTFRNAQNNLLPVQNVRFTLFDVDEWTAGGVVSYQDTATLSAGTWTSVGANVTGLNTATATAIANDSGASCTTLSTSATCQAAATIAPTSTASVTGFTLTYKNFLATPTAPYQEVAVSNVLFCVEPALVPVTIKSVDSLQDASGLAVEWTTTMEMANAGFNVYGAVGQAWRRLNDTLIPSPVINTAEPQHYSAQFPGVTTDRILLEDVDIRGRGKQHGPFEVGRPHGRETKAKRVDLAGIKRANAAQPRGAKTALALKAAQATPLAASGTQSSARLAVTESGVQRITHAELAAAHVDLGPDPSRIGLADGGRAVPRHVDDANGNGVFDAGDAIEFVGHVQPTLYSNANRYVLTSHGSHVAIAGAISRKGQGGIGNTYRADYRAYPDNEYSASAPVGSIPWYDGLLTSLWAPELERSFDLPDLDASSTEQASLTVDLWGLSDFAGGDDHHVVAYLNGVQVADSRFGGLTLKQLTVNVATSALKQSGNVLKLSLGLDTGKLFDFVGLDGFHLDYPAFALAKNGVWSGDVPRNRRLEVGAPGDCTGLHVWAQDDPSTQNSLRAYRATGLPAVVDAGVCRIVLPAQRTGATRYWLAQDDAVRNPAVEAGVPQGVARAGRDTAYLIISHPLFVDALGGLVGLQQSRGLQAQVVTTEAIYAAHSDHQRDANAIQAFIKATATQPGSKLRYVLLVGGDGYDYFDILGHEALSLVPTRYAKVGDLINFAPTDVSYGDIDGDGLPDRPVGRIIARTVAELDAVVGKLIAYRGGNSALLVTGKSDAGGSLPAQHMAMSSSLAGSRWQVSDIAVDSFGHVNDARASLRTALGTGYPLISYLGHSDYDFWDFGPLFDRTDIAFMPPNSPAVVTQWACWNSYFVAIYLETLAHSLLLTEGRGAASVIGSSTLTDLAAHDELGRRFFAILAQGPIALGDALLRAQRQVGTQFPGMRDDILAMGVLGDPALVVGGR